MIHLKATCDKRRTKKDGTSPIVFRITLSGKSRDIASGLSCKPSEWDYKKNRVKSVADKLIILSTRIKQQELDLLNRIKEFENKYPENNSVQQVKTYLSSKNTYNTVESFWQNEIAILKRRKKYNYAQSYEACLNALSNVTSMKIQFEDINYAWLDKTETLLKENGLKTNSIAVYLRTLRTVYNKAINVEVADITKYPFRKYRIKTENTPPRVASIEELQSFFNSNPSNRQEEDALNYAKLIFMLRGINFIDLALLTFDNIKGDRIIYKRSKTSKIYSIEILPVVKELINCYSETKRDTLFPILSNEELRNKQQLPNRIRQLRKTCNKWLGRIGKREGIQEKVTTYLFRYSWASACQKLGYSKELISRGLGHSFGLSVTNCYLEDYDVTIIDEMNRTVCNKIIRKAATK